MSLAYSKTRCTACQRQTVMSCDGRTIGYLEGDTFIKPVIGSKHRLLKPPAWAVDSEAFDHQIKTMATMFRVEDKETDVVYEVSVAYFDEHKGQLDRGFGRQYFLPLSRWKVDSNGNGKKPLQLAFSFGGDAIA